MINETSKKLALWFLGIVGVGVLVWFIAMYMDPEARAKRDVLKYFEDLQAQYETDTYGGATPEETLTLFIKALEAEDIELASKYFLPDEREKTRGDLRRAQQEDKILQLIERIKNFKLDKKTEEEAFFSIIDKDNVVEFEVNLSKNHNGVWKITEL